MNIRPLLYALGGFLLSCGQEHTANLSEDRARSFDPIAIVQADPAHLTVIKYGDKTIYVSGENHKFPAISFQLEKAVVTEPFTFIYENTLRIEADELWAYRDIVKRQFPGANDSSAKTLAARTPDQIRSSFKGSFYGLEEPVTLWYGLVFDLFTRARGAHHELVLVSQSTTETVKHLRKRLANLFTRTVSIDNRRFYSQLAVLHKNAMPDIVERMSPFSEAGHAAALEKFREHAFAFAYARSFESIPHYAEKLEIYSRSILQALAASTEDQSLREVIVDFMLAGHLIGDRNAFSIDARDLAQAAGSAKVIKASPHAFIVIRVGDAHRQGMVAHLLKRLPGATLVKHPLVGSMADLGYANKKAFLTALCAKDECRTPNSSQLRLDESAHTQAGNSQKAAVARKAYLDEERQLRAAMQRYFAWLDKKMALIKKDHF